MQNQAAQNLANNPVTIAHLLDLLAALASRIETITTSGILIDENLDDYEAAKLRSKITHHQTEASRLRQQLAKVRAYIKRQRLLANKKK